VKTSRFGGGVAAGVTLLSLLVKRQLICPPAAVEVEEKDVYLHILSNVSMFEQGLICPKL